MSSDFNKKIVQRFNYEALTGANRQSFEELMHADFINHTAPAGTSKEAEGMWNMITNLLLPAFPDLKVEIHEQVAEGDMVTTRKTLYGTHLGLIMGLAPTGKQIQIEVMDMVRIKDGQYYEHWGINTLPLVIQNLKGLAN